VKINGSSGVDPITAYSAQQKKDKVEIQNKQNGAVRSDTLQISTEARQMQHYKVKLAELPAVREELVASLKQKILDGTYKPDQDKIAAALLEERRLDRTI
jgi:negative regulator of flagellin synthesis FlgM